MISEHNLPFVLDNTSPKKKFKYVIVAFLITTSVYFYTVQTISSPFGVGGSWKDYVLN